MMLYKVPLLAFAFAIAAGTAGAEVTLKLASNAIRSNPAKVGDQVAFDWLATQLEQQTNGEVLLDVYWGGSLGAESTLLQSLQTGVVDILPNTGSNIATSVSEAGLLSVGYLFRDFDHYKAVANDDAFFGRLQEIVKEYDLGYQLAGLGATGSRNLYNRVREVETPEDAKGLKVRVQNSPIEFKVWQALGLLPTSIASTEIYMSLQTGVVDAAESSVPFIVSNKYYEVAPFITMTNHQISTHLYFISDLAIEKIPEEHRQTVMDLLRETGNIHIDATKELSAALTDTLKSQPNVTVSEPDTRPFADILAPLQGEVAADLGVTDLLEVIRAH